MSATKFFKDNLDQLASPATDPKSWNLNAGLLAMARQLDELERTQKKHTHALQQIEHVVRHLPTR